MSQYGHVTFPSGLFVFLFILGFCVIMAVFSCVLKRKQRRQAATRLRTPLMDRATAHRLDVALRDAEDAHVECVLCGFENFHSATTCCICGEQLSLTTARTDLPMLLSARQQRVRQRKQWTRCIDANGKLVWYQDTSSKSSIDTADDPFPALVLHLVSAVSASPRSPPPATDASARQSGRDDSEIAVTVVCHTSDDRDTDGDTEVARGTPVAASPSSTTALRSSTWTPLTLATRTQALVALVRKTSLQLVDALAADAALLPLVSASTEQTTIQWHDSLAISTKPFPAKYAHFVTVAAALIEPATRAVVKLNVRRAHVLADSIEGLCILPRASIWTTLRVNFVDEIGIDAGALQREWFALVSEQLPAAAAGVFTCLNRDDQSLYLRAYCDTDTDTNSNNTSMPQLAACFAIGRFVGRALLEGVALGFHLALPLLKIVLGEPVAFSDLASLDPELHRNLSWLLNHDNVAALGLDFSITEFQCGTSISNETTVVVDLIPNGRTIALTDANKQLYVTRRFTYVVFERVVEPMTAFLTGLYEVVPHDLLATFDTEELDFVLCGSDTIDVDDWMTHTRYSSELLRSLPVVQWFWELVRELPLAARQRLLHFATGSSRVPVGGFRALTSHDGRLCAFALKGVSLTSSGGYISSHACFNRLDLPLHTDRAQLRAVLFATLDADVYGFTTA